MSIKWQQLGVVVILVLGCLSAWYTIQTIFGSPNQRAKTPEEVRTSVEDAVRKDREAFEAQQRQAKQRKRN